jgi:hypothetical protein
VITTTGRAEGELVACRGQIKIKERNREIRLVRFFLAIEEVRGWAILTRLAIRLDILGFAFFFGVNSYQFLKG